MTEDRPEMLSMRWTFVALLVLFAGLGCAQKKVVTIATQPPDALVRVDGIDRGPAPVRTTIVFKDVKDLHRVTATRKGYKPRDVTLARDQTGPRVNIDLRPLTRVVNIIVDPVPATVRINGQPVAPEPVSTISRELEFTVSSPTSDDW